MGFKIIPPITHVEVIARGTGVEKSTRDRLRRLYGPGSWRKMKGRAWIKLRNGRLRYAEVHRYEAHGVGPKDHKFKKYLD